MICRAHPRRTMTALALAAALMAALFIPGGTVRAVDLAEPCAVTVHPSGADFAPDLAQAHVAVDLYQISNAVEQGGSWGWRLLAPYTDLRLTDSMERADWQALAQSAAEVALAEGTPIVTGAAGSSRIDATNAGNPLTAGVYLVLVRSGDAEEYTTTTTTDEEGVERIATVVRSPEYAYTFLPELVALPAESEEETVYDLTVTMKPERRARYGELEIQKTLRATADLREPVTCVFSVEATLDGRSVYSDVAAVTFSQPGQKTLLLDRIPVGATVTVRELYSGAECRLVSAETQTAAISAEAVARVAFVNEYDGGEHGGHGIVNHFAYGAANGWEWTPNWVLTRRS
ncbi:MAG: hypothetical protein IJ713_00320 [Oscillibacter sp.]|nr:hypothetical protein [Oscillibacter sp.]